LAVRCDEQEAAGHGRASASLSQGGLERKKS
jgi:hypothetical protein